MQSSEYERRTDPDIAVKISGQAYGRERMQRRPKSILQSVLAGTLVAAGVAGAFFPDQTHQALQELGLESNNGQTTQSIDTGENQNPNVIVDPRK